MLNMTEESHNLNQPILTPDKPLYVFLKELKEHSFQKMKPKYDLILEFLNRSFNLEMKSLIHFKKYDFAKLDIDNFEKILDEYKYKLEGELQIDIDDFHIDVVKILSDCLNSIDYSIHTHKEKNEKNGEIKIFLTIINEPKKIINTENKTSISKEVKKYKKENNKIKRNKKKCILDFINAFLGSENKIKSLTKFKDINISIIEEDIQKYIITKHQDILKNNFDIDIDDDDDIESVLNKCLKNINYQIIKTKTKNEKTKKREIFLSIKEKKGT